MKKTASGLLFLAALLLATAFPTGETVQSNNPGTTVQPLLSQCSDVNGADGAVGAADLALLVSVFGDTPADPTYRLLYDAAAVGAIGASDIAAVVADFGDNITNGSCALVDYQIAVATLAITSPSYSNVLCGGTPMSPANCGGSTQFLMENAAFLLSRGYVLASADVQGQGKHYINYTYFNDDVFNPARPEGLVYDNGKLAAQLYYIDGDAVGWGPEPPPVDNVQIDAFCTPGCSFAGAYDGWHLHSNLCTYLINAVSPLSPQHTLTATAAQCEAVHDANCGSQCGTTTWSWDERVGWMGHLWNHTGNANTNPLDINGNGRFADCYPDPPDTWKGFNCPGMGM